jgi:hypothetical protein
VEASNGASVIPYLDWSVFENRNQARMAIFEYIETSALVDRQRLAEEFERGWRVSASSSNAE